MKIYEIGTGYTPIPAQMGAATEIVVAELTKAFLEQGEAVEIIDIATDNRAPNDLPIREVKVPKCFSGTDVKLGLMHKLKRVVYSVALAGELKKILKQTDEKVVLHFHNQYNLFFFLKLTSKRLRRKCLIAYTNHSGIWRLEWEEIKDTIHKRYFQEAECMKRADVVFVLNEETRKNAMVHLGISEDRFHVVANGVNTDIYYPLPEEEKWNAKEKWGLQGCKVILQVGSVYENKGQLRSLEVLLPWLKENTCHVFAYAGGIVDPDYQQLVQQFAKENAVIEQVCYLGMVQPGREMNEVYNVAEATILASRFESFGMVAIESLSAGTPVLLHKYCPYYYGEGSVRYENQSDLSVIDGVSLCNDARKNAVMNYSWVKIAKDYYRVMKVRM